jgi:two-component system clock-associated histidine kinase SasA
MLLPSGNNRTNLSNENYASNSLQLLLFVDDRRSSQKNVENLKNYLDSLTQDYQFQLEVIEIAQYPHLVEHFKLVATPALVKINPPPKQTLAGSDLTAQLQKWWFKWQKTLQLLSENPEKIDVNNCEPLSQTCIPSSDLIRINDEVFSLKQEKEQLIKQLKFKDQMLKMLVHDLRNPLFAASLAVDTLELMLNLDNLEKVPKSPQQLCQEAKKQFVIMNKMITELLDISQSIGSELKILPSELFLPELCHEILLSLEPKFREKNQNICSDIPQDLPSVYGDEELIRQVIVNLLENAIKYTPNNGKISLSILHKTSQQIQVSIKDNGLGIPEDQKEHIFDGYFRLERDENTEGYGIGLALCRKVIHAHYGRIWVDSDGKNGSCFHFTLPVFR